MDFINLPILIFSILLCISILTSLVSARAGVPLILIFLCIGLVAGAGDFELLEMLQRPKICFFIGSLALALILFDSGFQTEMKNYRLAQKPAITLATLGVVATTALMAPCVRTVLNIGWIEATLLAATISSTDSAAVFFLLRSQGVKLRERVKATLEVESGANDPMAIFLTMSCIMLLEYQAQSGENAYHYLVFLFLGQLLIGGGMGYLLGRVIQSCVNHVKLESALYPIFVIGLVLAGFAITNILGGSGFLAVYIAGLLVGNGQIQARSHISRFQQTVTWLSQITMFTCLGLFVSVSGLRQYWLPAVMLGGFLMFIVRPAMIIVILSFFKNYSFLEKVFISFVGLRGATSILLALMPIVYEFDFSEAFFNIIFIMVLFSLALQGFFIPVMAKWCRVSLPISSGDPAAASVDLPGLMDSSLILYQLTETSPVVLGEKIPRWAVPSLVVRSGVAYFAGGVLRRLKANDKVYVFLPSGSRRALLDHLYGSGGNSDGQSSRDIFGDFPIAPTTTFGDLMSMYGVQVPKHLLKQSIVEFMQNELTDIEIGDRLSLGSVELVVRSINDGKLTGIGLDVDPTRQRSFYARTQAIENNKL